MATDCKDPQFGFAVPVREPVFWPRSTWVDSEAYGAQVRKLVQMFIANFAKFSDGVGAGVLNASPHVAVAAE